MAVGSVIVLALVKKAFTFPRGRICDLRSHVTNSKTHFLPMVSSYWLVAFGFD